MVEQPDSRTPVFVVEPVNGGRKRTLHRNLLLPVESVREDSPEVKPDEKAIQKAPLSTRKIRAHTPSSATPKPVLHEVEAKSTLSLMEDEGESDLDDQEFDVVVTEPRAQIGTSRPCSPLCDPDSERPDGVGSPTLDVCSPDTLPPETSSRHTSPSPPTPPVPAPRRSARAKQPPSWHATGEFAMSSIDKLAELKKSIRHFRRGQVYCDKCDRFSHRKYLVSTMYILRVDCLVGDDLPQVGGVCRKGILLRIISASCCR